ncbi:hypothetical protein B0J17DRAFT_51141 [Rhizoctonia solani]|nr:hypothetical protein B0J17DRAFT_51141 [Rhizoctonia solani]
MSRFSAISLLFTVLSILIWATQVNTPLHSDLSLRTVEVLPPVYPLLTISGPSPSARSQCIGKSALSMAVAPPAKLLGLRRLPAPSNYPIPIFALALIVLATMPTESMTNSAGQLLSSW